MAAADRFVFNSACVAHTRIISRGDSILWYHNILQICEMVIRDIFPLLYLLVTSDSDSSANISFTISNEVFVLLASMLVILLC
ncbi:hypothetical protein GW750_00885 [bacterium]|nr:hypothetical protein [bacterium]